MEETVPKTDTWVWGNEILLWGFAPDHQYTCKVLEPKVGRPGMLSLQYHHQKSETWIQLRGISWALVIIDDTVCTRIMHPGDIQNLKTGTIHRLMGLTDDCRVLEPSTPDRHAADKSVEKDVVRLHCVQGRAVTMPNDERQKKMVADAITVSEQAIEAVQKNTLPVELNKELLLGKSGFHINF